MLKVRGEKVVLWHFRQLANEGIILLSQKGSCRKTGGADDCMNDAGGNHSSSPDPDVNSVEDLGAVHQEAQILAFRQFLRQ